MLRLDWKLVTRRKLCEIRCKDPVVSLGSSEVVAMFMRKLMLVAALLCNSMQGAPPCSTSSLGEGGVWSLGLLFLDSRIEGLQKSPSQAYALLNS